MFTQIPFLRPPFGSKEKYAAYKVMSGNNISIGPEVREFEKDFEDYIKCHPSPLSVCNGTIALDLVWQTFLHTGRLKRGDKVLLPSYTFVAVPNSVVNNGLIPVFCDIDPRTWNIDTDTITSELKHEIKAVVAVHTFGNPCNMNKLHLYGDPLLIEDCAEACGAEFNGDKVGTFGDAAVFSFNATKNMTTGEGGMVCFNGIDSSKNTEVAHLIRENGFGYTTRNATIPGHNYRLDNIHCAIGIEQLKTLDERNKRRIGNAMLYSVLLKKRTSVKGIQYPTSYPVYQIYGALFDNRDEVYEYLVKSGIECKKYFDPPCHAQDYYHKNYIWPDFPVTEEISSKILCLPFDDKLSIEEIEYVVDKISEIT